MGKFESRSEFRMGQTKTVGGACGTSGLNIEEVIEAGRYRTVYRLWVMEIILY